MNAGKYRNIRFSAMLLAAVLASAGAYGQGRGGGGPRLSDAERDTVWTLEATGVSKQIGLSEGDTGKVVAAYKTSRASHGKAMEEMMATAERGPGMFQEMQAIADAERGKLAKELEVAIGKENADKAVATLGTYNRQWDRFVLVVSEFGLEDAKQAEALNHIAKYVVDADKAQQDAFASFDIEGLRATMGELKSGLDTSMAGVLSAEQLATWKEKTAGRGGPGGGGRGGGPGGGPGGGGPGGGPDQN